MNSEYRTDERVSLTGTGSSARLLTDDEVTPGLRRMKDEESRGMSDKYIQMFCERYRDRRVSAKVHADFTEQRKNEALDRAIAPGSYVKAERLSDARGGEKLNRYRSGVSQGKRYMTVDDFDRYYHDQRGYRFPQYRAAAEADARHDPAELLVETTAAGEIDLPKKAGWLTDNDKLPAFVQKLLTKKFFRRLNEWAGETFPRETTVTVSPVRARRVPASVAAGLVIAAVSMSMVIGSKVLVSQSTREVSELKDALREKESVVSTLNDQLDLKNDLLGIRDIASNELGMVSEKYLPGQYLDPAGQGGEDYLEVFDGEGGSAQAQQSGWSRLLSAFGIGKK